MVQNAVKIRWAENVVFFLNKCVYVPIHVKKSCTEENDKIVFQQNFKENALVFLPLILFKNFCWVKTYSMLKKVIPDFPFWY